MILPYLILGTGSVIVLMTGAFIGPKAGKRLIYLAALIAGLACVAALFGAAQGEIAGGFIVVDSFSKTFTAAASFAAVLVLLLSVGYTSRRPLGAEEYPSVALFAAFGMSLLVSSDSLLGLFLGLESMSLALYILLASNKSDARSGEAGLKYLVTGAVSTGFFSYGLSLVYAASGTFSVSDSMNALLAGPHINALGLAGWGMMIVGMGFKVSLFPFNLWAPDVYEGGPAPVVAFLSTMSKTAVFAMFLRLATSTGNGWWHITPALWVMAACSMAFGNIAALTQDNVKRMLAYSSIAQMGYVLMGVLAAPYIGTGPTVFYLIAYSLMELGAFGVVGTLSDEKGEFGDIRLLRGLGYIYPHRSFALALCIISLAGLPPTAGFIGKFGIFAAVMKAEFTWLAVIGIITAIISVYFYLRVVVYLYMRTEEWDTVRYIMPRVDYPGRVALAVIVAGVVYLGVFPGGLLEFLSDATGVVSTVAFRF